MYSASQWEDLFFNNSRLGEFERILLSKCLAEHTMVVETDDNGQLVFYTNFAETKDGNLAEFDSDVPEGTYKVWNVE